MKFCWTLEGLGKSEFKELISLHAKKLDYIFDGMLYKQLDHVYPFRSYNDRPKEAVRRCFSEYVFRPAKLLKKDSNTGVSLWISGNF